MLRCAESDSGPHLFYSPQRVIKRHERRLCRRGGSTVFWIQEVRNTAAVRRSRLRGSVSPLQRA
ncbi:hypothetical protein FQN60_013615, partial [Etheostoma spectabile]